MEWKTHGNETSKTTLIQPVDDHDLSFIEQEIQHIQTLSGTDDFTLITVKAEQWNRDLSPWEAPAVFGKEDFGNGAERTLQFIQEDILWALPNAEKLYIGGYSLAGLFALWAAYQTDIFTGVAAVSPSVWFPGFTDYARENPLQVQNVYLSLGDKEERTRNKTMAQVGDAIRTLDELYTKQKIHHTLEWNVGNHFQEPDLRTAKGFSWLLQQQATPLETYIDCSHTVRVLHKAGIETMEQLAPLTEADLLMLRGIGPVIAESVTQTIESWKINH